MPHDFEFPASRPRPAWVGARRWVGHVRIPTSAPWVAVSGVVVAIAAAWQLTGVGHVFLGLVPVPWETPLLVAMVFAAFRCGPFTWRNVVAWREYLAAVAVVVAVGTWFYATRSAGWAEALMLVWSSASEEVTYRFAVAVVVAATARVVRVPSRLVVPAAAFVSAAWFAVLPGHVAQMVHPAMAAIWFTISIGMSVVIWRAGGLVAAMAAHAAMNLMSFNATFAGLDFTAQLAGTSVAVLGLAAGAVLAGRRLGTYDNTANTVPSTVAVTT